MKVKSLLVILAISLTGLSVSCAGKRISGNFIPEYPVFLVHGIGFSADSALIDYWQGVKPVLDKAGVIWFESSQPAFGLIENNAEILKSDIISFLEENPRYSKVNIIAHSRGGLESRYMISKLGMDGRIASLTTIATPHRGSSIADVLYRKIEKKDAFIVKFINMIYGITDDSSADAYLAGQQLTTEEMSDFNLSVKDSPLVYYQSFAGQITAWYPNPLFATLSTVLEKYEGPNDGLVSVKSAAWGRFRGIPYSRRKHITSHASLIGFEQLDDYCVFDAERFIRDIITELSLMGY